MTESDAVRLQRWRLILGAESDSALAYTLDETSARRDRVLAFLYDREYGLGRNRRRSAGLGDSALSIPEWVSDVRELFPRETIERLEKDAIERYGIQELVTDPEMLKRAVPSLSLLKAVLQTKHLMNQAVLTQARHLVAKVVAELLKKMTRAVETPFSGVRNRSRRSFIKNSRNFDPRRTIRHNLHTFDPLSQRLVIREPWFNSRTLSSAGKWQILIAVDQSGSMTDSVIHSAVTASIFWRIPAIQTHLVLFDTNIVDVTDHCQDPVETLMKVQLGGGTDIGHALKYIASLVHTPKRCIVILISDFYEGAPEHLMLAAIHQMVESGVKFLGLAALDSESFPAYNRNLAEKMVNLGAEVGAMTPGQLAAWLGEKIQ